MTVELACSQESRNRHTLRFPEVNPTLNVCTNRTQAHCRNGYVDGTAGYRRLLCLAAPVARRPYARVPLLILGVGITEPPPTRRAVYSRRVRAGWIAR